MRLLNKQGHFVHIWYENIQTELPIYLSDGELEKSEGFLHLLDSKRYISAHSFLRNVLAKYTEIAPIDLKFDLLENGKPQLQNKGSDQLHFSLSYRGDWVMVGISDSEIGVDIEKITPLSNMERIRESLFTKEENQVYFAAPIDQQITCFFSLWTQKEAYLKALGKGLSDPCSPVNYNWLLWETKETVSPSVEYMSAVCHRCFGRQEFAILDIASFYAAALDKHSA